MQKRSVAIVALLLWMVAPIVRSAPVWTEGIHYFAVDPPQRTTVPAGKVEVMEVFSYGCPACAQFNPIMHQLKLSLPHNAQVVYLPAAFIPTEDWPMFQRAYYTAQALGIAERTHDAMFDAVWRTGELATTDTLTGRLKNPQPTIEAAARFYNQNSGVSVDKFVTTAKSFAIETHMKDADALIKTFHVDRTPTIIVNGKYRLHVESAGGVDQLIELVNWLVAKESK